MAWHSQQSQPSQSVTIERIRTVPVVGATANLKLPPLGIQRRKWRGGCQVRAVAFLGLRVGQTQKILGTFRFAYTHCEWIQFYRQQRIEVGC